MLVDGEAEGVVGESLRGDEINGLFDVGREEEKVVAGHESEQLSVAVTVGVGNAFHVETVGDDEAIETEAIFEKVGDDGAGERGWVAGVEGVDLKVGYHDAANTLVNQSFKWIEFNRIEVCGGVVDDREVEVGIDIGVAVARKMFGDREDTLTLHTFGIHNTQLGDALAVGAEGTGTDDGVIGV